MNSKGLFLIIALLSQGFFISCNNDNSKKYSIPVNKDSTAGLTIVPNEIKENIDTIYVRSSKQIIGTWEELGKESLTVDITKNMISYREHHESHNFKIKSDSIYIYYSDLTLSGRTYLICALVGLPETFLRLSRTSPLLCVRAGFVAQQSPTTRKKV